MNSFKIHENEAKITTGFTTPEGYFEAFENRLLAQLPTQKPKVIAFYQRKSTWYYAAAAVVVLLLSVPVYQNIFPTAKDVDATVLADYLATHSNLSEEDLATIFEQEDLDNMKMELDLGEEAIEDILLYNNDLEQYIID